MSAILQTPSPETQLADLGLVCVAVAHDLNNAVSVAVALTEIALNESALPETARRDLRGVQEAGKRARLILDNFRRLATSGTLPLEYCDIHALIRTTIRADESALAGGKSPRLKLVHDTPFVMASVGHLSRAIGILINPELANADAEAVSVTTEYLSRPGRSMPLLKVSVEHPGVKLSDQHMAQLAKPLSVDGDLDKRAIGLYLCSAIAMYHEGRFCIERLDGKGVRYIFYLPIVVIK